MVISVCTNRFQPVLSTSLNLDISVKILFHFCVFLIFSIRVHHSFSQNLSINSIDHLICSCILSLSRVFIELLGLANLVIQKFSWFQAIPLNS
ncbi:hypothetical protein HOA93_00370, partial [bacterium]|nr:hypothetical protein [bacterium]